MKRRKFLRSSSVVALGPLAGCKFIDGAAAGDKLSKESSAIDNEPPVENEPRKKNIVFIVADDLNISVDGFGGHPQAVTPNINRLRNRGVTFTNAHANSPLCAPSRPSFLSGLLASSTGHYHSNPKKFRDRPAFKDAVLLPEHLRSNGYQSFITGKIGHGSNSALYSSASSAEEMGYSTSYGPYPWNGDRNLFPTNSKNYEFPSPIQRKSFGFGPLSAPPQWENGVAKWFYGDWGYLGSDGRVRGEFHYQGHSDRSLLPDELSTNWVVDLLKGESARSTDRDGRYKYSSRIGEDKPFAIFLGLTKPHMPNYVPDEYFQRVLEANSIESVNNIKLPQLPEGDFLDPPDGRDGDDTSPEDVDDIPRWRLRNPNGTSKGRYHDMILAAEDWDGGVNNLFRSAVHAYLASILFVDDQVGKILDVLDETNLTKDTVVVFLSDHGYARGEKESFFKYTVWSESTRVPLIVADPSPEYDDSRGDSSNHPVSLVDVYPTLVSILGMSAIPVTGETPPIDGKDMSALLLKPRSKPDGLNQVAVSMIKTWKMKTSENWIDPDLATVSGVSEHWRYTQSFNDGSIEEELYNLKDDPYEWDNLADNPELEEVKKYFDFYFSGHLKCKGKARTQYYAGYIPNDFTPDAIV